MHFKHALIIITSLFVIFSHSSHAMSNQSPATLWRAYDLKGQARSVLKFYEVNGELRADVVKILLENGTYCTQCKGQLKNKPYLGMTIIRGLHFKRNKWVGGEVLDTDTGNTYSCNVSLSNDGNIMHLHAYKGIPLFGRTVEWQRENDDP